MTLVKMKTLLHAYENWDLFSTALLKLEGNQIKQPIMKSSITKAPLKHFRKI